MMSPFDAAVKYHVSCELYDRTVCTGVGIDGVLPTNGWEQGKINQNASREFSLACRNAGLPSYEMHQFIIDESVHRESQRLLTSFS